MLNHVMGKKTKQKIADCFKDWDENGDGNNDVSMINEAHVGVGLYGNEGLRAV